MIRRFAIPLAALLLVVAGCTPAAQPTSSDDDATDPQSITENTQAVIPDGVVATGALTTVAGGPVGEVTIIRDGDAYRIDYPDLDQLALASQMTDPRLSLSDSPFSPDECGDANIWQLGFGDDAIRTVGFDAEIFPSGDWSFFTSIVVVGFLEPGAAECTQPILATAPLTWDQPVVRPWVEPVDGGQAAGAMGEVDGALYTTSAGDTWDAIAARFGVSAGDLEWLNPIRIPGQPRTAYADQVLNLDPEHRSDSESRRPH
jgi:hypothetical protein